MLSVPQTPQAEDPADSAACWWATSPVGGVTSVTVTTLNSCSGAGRVGAVGHAGDLGGATPSWTSQPAASSKSWPGVRIVTQTRWASTPGQARRISSGSSVASRSSRVRSAASRSSVTRVRTVGPGRRASSATVAALVVGEGGADREPARELVGEVDQPLAHGRRHARRGRRAGPGPGSGSPGRRAGAGKNTSAASASIQPLRTCGGAGQVGEVALDVGRGSRSSWPPRHSPSPAASSS